jgi:hypothetical protein
MEKKDSIMYQVTLEHTDFVLLLDVLRKARECELITWSATDLVCANTKVIAN